MATVFEAADDQNVTNKQKDDRASSSGSWKRRFIDGKSDRRIIIERTNLHMIRKRTHGNTAAPGSREERRSPKEHARIDTE
jgi:hypothetical protein